MLEKEMVHFFRSEQYYISEKKESITPLVIAMNLHLADLLENGQLTDSEHVEALRKASDDYAPVEPQIVTKSHDESSITRRWIVEKTPGHVIISRHDNASVGRFALAGCLLLSIFVALIWICIFSNRTFDWGFANAPTFGILLALHLFGLALLIVFIQTSGKSALHLDEQTIRFSQTYLGIGRRRLMQKNQLDHIDIAPSQDHRNLDIQEVHDNPEAEYYELRLFCQGRPVESILCPIADLFQRGRSSCHINSAGLAVMS